jgi:hypothetical protein
MIQVKLSLCLIKHHAMKAYAGMHYFLTSVPYGGEWSASRSDHCRGKKPGARCMEVQSGRCEKENTLLAQEGIEHIYSIFKHVS